MATINRKITLAARPVGFPKVSDFDLVYSPLPLPAAGAVLVRSVYLSLDPHMRRGMNAAESDTPSVAIGAIMPGRGVAFVVSSDDPAFQAGDAVVGMFGWQELAVVQGRQLRKLDLHLAPLSTALGVLGMPGLTAFFGLLDVCNPRPGETVMVSGAAGAVGALVGQIAKIRGCRVVGSAGSEAKISWLLDELGFDAAFNYKTVGDLGGELEVGCPDGIDVYFDTVGGAITDAVLQQLQAKARVSVCGQASQDNLMEPEKGLRWLDQLVIKQAKLQGFLVSGYVERFPEGLAQLAGWLDQGKLKYWESITQGIESAPQAFIGMLRGINHGKQLVQLSDP